MQNARQCSRRIRCQNSLQDRVAKRGGLQEESLYEKPGMPLKSNAMHACQRRPAKLSRRVQQSSFVALRSRNARPPLGSRSEERPSEGVDSAPKPAHENFPALPLFGAPEGTLEIHECGTVYAACQMLASSAVLLDSALGVLLDVLDDLAGDVHLRRRFDAL